MKVSDNKKYPVNNYIVDSAKGVSGMGINQSQSFPYEMVLLLKKFLILIKKGEQVVEVQRQKLAALQNFEPHAAFQRIDRNNDGVVSSVDLLKFLRENGVEEADESDCHAITKYFDSEGEGLLYFNDFLQILMPCDDPNLRAEIAQRPIYLVQKEELLPQLVEQNLSCLFEKEIAFNRVLEEMKQHIECNKQFDYSKAFHEIDDWSYGYIDKKNLKSFLRKHGHVANNKEVLSIIRRMDLDGDARLTKEEFIRGLKPDEPYSKLVKRQKEKQRSKSRFNEKINNQGAKYLNYQDTAINFVHGQRDTLRTQVQDRALASRSYERYGNLGSSALKLRPDLHRQNQGFFMKETYNNQLRRSGQKKSCALILTKRYNEQDKMAFTKRQQRGEFDEEFRQRNVWRPGGQAVKVKTQQEADVSLLSVSKSMKSPSSQKKRPKSAQQTRSLRTKKVKKVKKIIESSEPEIVSLPVRSNSEDKQSDDLNSYHAMALARNKEDYYTFKQQSAQIEEQTPIQNKYYKEDFKFSNERSDDLKYSIDKREDLKFSNDRKDDYQYSTDKRNEIKFSNDLQQSSYKKDDFQFSNDRQNELRQSSYKKDESKQNQWSSDQREIDQNLTNEKFFSDTRTYNAESELKYKVKEIDYDNFKETKYEVTNYKSQKNYEQTKLQAREASLSKSPRLEDMRAKELDIASAKTRQNPSTSLPEAISSVPSGTKVGQLPPGETKFFIKSLMELLNLSRKLESAKMELAQCRDFNIMDAFSIFDEHGRGFCGQADFRMILTNLGMRIQPDHTDVIAVYKRYNKTKDGLLKYSEFMNAVCPLSQQYANMMKNRKAATVYSKTRHPITMFQSQTYSAFLHVLESIIQTETATEKIRFTLRNRRDFSASCAFSTVAYQQPYGQRSVEQITWRDVKETLTTHGHGLNLEDLDAQLLIDRFDRDGDGIINLNEWHEMITPTY